MSKGQRLIVRRDVLLLAGVSLLVSLIVVFVVFPAQQMVANQPDPYSFGALGRDIANGLGFRGEMLGRRAPLYPILVGVLYTVFGAHEWIVQVAQCLMLATVAVLVYDLAVRVYDSRRAGILAGLACAFHPSLLRYAPDFHLEVLLTLVFTLMVWTSVVLYQRPSFKNAVGFGIMTGLAALTKAVVLLYPAIFGALWLLTRPQLLRAPLREKTQAVLPIVVACVAMVLTIAPWTIRNYTVSGKIVPVSTGLSDAFLRGFAFTKPEYLTLREPPYTGAENEVNQYFQALCAAEGAVWEKDPLQTEAILGREAKRRLLADPGAAVKKGFFGIFTFWYEMTSLKTSLVAGLLAALAWLTAALGMGRAWREKRPQWLIYAPVLYLNFFLAVLLSLGRYSVPVLPTLIVASGFGVDTLLRRFSGARAASAPASVGEG